MKKTLAIIISTLLVLTLFSACKANKADETITPNPPTGTNITVKEEKKTEKAETTVKEIVPETERKEEVKTTLPEATASKPKVQETQKPKPQVNSTTEKTEIKTTVPATGQELNISRDKAKTIALAHAGLAETDISRYKSELDRERKTIVYEIEFDAGKYEYDYEIDANSGKVIKAQKEIRD